RLRTTIPRGQITTSFIGSSLFKKQPAYTTTHPRGRRGLVEQPFILGGDKYCCVQRRRSAARRSGGGDRRWRQQEVAVLSLHWPLLALNRGPPRCNYGRSRQRLGGLSTKSWRG
ncbi:unnamed protein product, partial [Ectocarpus sp. 4 AP-2014]